MASGGKTRSGAAADGSAKTKKRKVGFSSDLPSTSCDANDCLKVHILLNAEGLANSEEGSTFDPEFSDRIFGDDGKIYGYTNLKIDLYTHASSFYTYVQIQFDSKSTSSKKPCTDVLGKLKEAFGDALTEDRDSFLQNLQTYSQDFTQMIKNHGESIFSWTTVSQHSSEKSDKQNQIVRLELSDPAVRAWHEKLNPLALLCIDGAQPIQNDEPFWEVYLAIEGEEHQMRVAGFCNVYHFYHYPDSERLRIAQILVLPIYQGRGFGLQLLKEVNRVAKERNCYDVTMEQPSMALQNLRDTMDVLRLLSVPSMIEDVRNSIRKIHSGKESSGNGGPAGSGNHAESAAESNGERADAKSPSSRLRQTERSLLHAPVERLEEARETLQISKLQFKRCWEQLLFMFINLEDKEGQDVFRAAVVQRLSNEIFEKDNATEKSRKRVIDTVNDYDSTKTFVMMRKRKVAAAVDDNGSVAVPQDADVSKEAVAIVPDAEERAKVLQEELKEREDEMLRVAQTVGRLMSTVGLAVPSLQHWANQVPGTSSID